MSSPYFRKDSGEEDLVGESPMPSCALKWSSCQPSTRSGKHRSDCIAKILDDRHFAELCFLNWVSFSRNLAGPGHITDNERLRCPILWCRDLFIDEKQLMDHVFRCARYSDGMYWCFHCQKEESFMSCQCKHCHSHQFNKERLSVKMKRLFRSFTNKSHPKEEYDTKTTLHNACNQYSEPLPLYGEALSLAVEMDSSEAFHELEAAYGAGAAELHGACNSLAELESPNAISSRLDGDVSYAYSNHSCPASNKIADFPSKNSSIDVVQALSPNSHEVGEPWSQSHVDPASKLATLDRTSMQVYSPVSPQHKEWTSGHYSDVICESPTNTDSCGPSIFSSSYESDISPPSTRSSTNQSSSQDSLATDESAGRRQLTVTTTEATRGMEVKDVTKEELCGAGQVDCIYTCCTDLIRNHDTSYPESCDWLTSNDLLIKFYKALSSRVTESSERLKSFITSPIIDELLSMTASTIIGTGFDALQSILTGRFQATIEQVFSLIHVTYACAVVVYNGQVESKLQNLLTHSLSIRPEVLSGEMKHIYNAIVWSIWNPPIQYDHLASSEVNTQSVYPSNGHWVPREEELAHKIEILERTISSLHTAEAPVTADQYPNKNNEIVIILQLFLDICEGTRLSDRVTCEDTNLLHNSKDELFIQDIEKYVTLPLIGARFEPGPSLEAFIKIVMKIDTLVSRGQITTVHEVEVVLKWAGRSITQSMELYGIFSSRVKELCEAVPCHLRLDPALLNGNHIKGINGICRDLELIISTITQPKSSVMYRCQLCDIPRNSSFHLEDETALSGKSFDHFLSCGVSQSNIKPAALYRRPAMKRKRPSNSSSSSLDENRSSQSSPSSNTFPEVLKRKYICSFCSFRPTGQKKYYGRTLRRHIVTRHGPGQKKKKKFFCRYAECEKSYTRLDNCVAHFRSAHLGIRRHSYPNNHRTATRLNVLTKDANCL